MFTLQYNKVNQDMTMQSTTNILLICVQKYQFYQSEQIRFCCSTKTSQISVAYYNKRLVLESAIPQCMLCERALTHHTQKHRQMEPPEASITTRTGIKDETTCMCCMAFLLFCCKRKIIRPCLMSKAVRKCNLTTHLEGNL